MLLTLLAQANEPCSFFDSVYNFLASPAVLKTFHFRFIDDFFLFIFFYCSFNTMFLWGYIYRRVSKRKGCNDMRDRGQPYRKLLYPSWSALLCLYIVGLTPVNRMVQASDLPEIVPKISKYIFKIYITKPPWDQWNYCVVITLHEILYQNVCCARNIKGI